MNAGIADAMNLSWLLAAHLNGWAPSSILDAYEAERWPITSQVSRFAMSHAEAEIRRRGAIPDEIEDAGAAGELARREVGHLTYEINVQQYACAGLNFGTYYDRSPIIAYDGAEHPAYTMNSYTPSTVPGCRTPHLWCEDGRSLYDAMGPEFTLLRFDPAIDVAPLEAAARKRGVPLKVLDIERPRAAIFYGGGLVLSRPDQHVAWRGNTLPADSLALIDRVRGAANQIAKPGSARRSGDALVFVRGDRFHQGHQLTLYGLILDLAVGPQQPQAERAVEKQQAFDLARLAVAVVEECDGHIERGGDLLKTGGADAVDALLVFLNLLEADAKLVAELRLRDPLLDAPQPDSLSQFNVGFAGTALLHLLCR